MTNDQTDPAEPGPAELDSGMASGGDEGGAGEPGPAPFPDPAGGGDAAAVEETPQALSAVHDDAPLPGAALGPGEGDDEDPRAPRFQEPGA